MNGWMSRIFRIPIGFFFTWTTSIRPYVFFIPGFIKIKEYVATQNQSPV